jgi:hypothetical protein
MTNLAAPYLRPRQSLCAGASSPLDLRPTRPKAIARACSQLHPPPHGLPRRFPFLLLVSHMMQASIEMPREAMLRDEATHPFFPHLSHEKAARGYRDSTDSLVI